MRRAATCVARTKKKKRLAIRGQRQAFSNVHQGTIKRLYSIQSGLAESRAAPRRADCRRLPGQARQARRAVPCRVAVVGAGRPGLSLTRYWRLGGPKAVLNHRASSRSIPTDYSRDTCLFSNKDT